jgi:hypothetical protein
MSRVLLTAFEGPAEAMRSVTRPAMESYCARHGYEDMIEVPKVAGYAPAWAKVPGLRDALSAHEGAVWVDADVLISQECPDLLDQGEQAMAYDPRCELATWLWAAQNTAVVRSFLDAVWERRKPEAIDTREWEQAAVHAVLATNGIRPTALDWPWCDRYGVARPDAFLVHASYNVGTWKQRAAYLAGEKVFRVPARGPAGYRVIPDGPYDCSAAVSVMLMHVHLLDRVLCSGDLMAWGQPGIGETLTVWANEGHCFMELRDTPASPWRHFGTGSDGTGWQRELHDHIGFMPRRWPGL